MWVILHKMSNEQTHNKKGTFIPSGCRPTCLYNDKDKAINDLLSLKKHCSGVFLLFEAVGFAKENNIVYEEIKGNHD